MKKDPLIFIDHILKSIAAIEKYIGEMEKDEFLEDQEKQDAVMRRLEVIGEAARNLPEDTRKMFSEIEWNKIIAMRNLLIHEYFGVNLNLVWSVVKKSIPELKILLEKTEFERAA